MKFSIRDLFLLTVIVAMGLGWWLDRSRLAAAKREFETDARYLSQFSPDPDDPFADPESTAMYRKYHPVPNSSPPAPNQPKP